MIIDPITKKKIDPKDLVRRFTNQAKMPVRAQTADEQLAAGRSLYAGKPVNIYGRQLPQPAAEIPVQPAQQPSRQLPSENPFMQPLSRLDDQAPQAQPAYIEPRTAASTKEHIGVVGPYKTKSGNWASEEEFKVGGTGAIIADTFIPFKIVNKISGNKKAMDPYIEDYKEHYPYAAIGAEAVGEFMNWYTGGKLLGFTKIPGGIQKGVDSVLGGLKNYKTLGWVARMLPRAIDTGIIGASIAGSKTALDQTKLSGEAVKETAKATATGGITAGLIFGPGASFKSRLANFLGVGAVANVVYNLETLIKNKTLTVEDIVSNAANSAVLMLFEGLGGRTKVESFKIRDHINFEKSKLIERIKSTGNYTDKQAEAIYDSLTKGGQRQMERLISLTADKIQKQNPKLNAEQARQMAIKQIYNDPAYKEFIDYVNKDKTLIARTVLEQQLTEKPASFRTLREQTGVRSTQQQAVMPASRQLPSGTSVRPQVTPVISPQVGFQMVDTTKNKELVKKKELLETAIAEKQKLVNSGKANANDKIRYKQLQAAVQILNNEIAALERERVIASGPVLTPEQQAARVAPAPAPAAPLATNVGQRVSAAPTVIQPISAPAAPKEVYSKLTKPEINKTLEYLKESNLITPELYTKTQKLIEQNIVPAYSFNKQRQVTDVKDSGKVIKGEVKTPAKKITAVKKETPKPIVKKTKVVPTKKPTLVTSKLSVRKLAAKKRAEKEEQKSLEAKRLAEVTAIKAKEAGKAKSYKEYLARAKAKEAQAKIEKTAPAAAAQASRVDALNKYLLERKIKQMVAANKMSAEEAAKARAKGKYNKVTDTIDYGKSKKSIDSAEDMPSIHKNDEQFKLFEHGYRLVKKYQKLTEKIGATFSEKNIPRGASGVAYESGSIRIKSLNSIYTIVHEIAHIIDRASGLRKRITDENIINQLAKAYASLYLQTPKAKINDAMRVKAIPEGLAAFIENYALEPNKTGNEYPLLVNAFLKPDGKYYDKLFVELIKDVRDILGQYKALDAVEKFQAHIVDNKREVDNKSFFNVYDKAKAFLFNMGSYLEKISNEVGTTGTVKDLSIKYETYRLWNRAFTHNVLGKPGTLKLINESYLAVDNNGNFNEIFDFNWGTLIKTFKSDLELSRYGGYLFARDTYFNYLELNEIKKDLNKYKKKLADLNEEYKLTENKEIKSRIKSVKNIIAELNSYDKHKSAMLEKRNKSFELAKAAYELDKGRWVEQDKMFDSMVMANLNAMFRARLITPEFYDYLSMRKGYAPTFVEYIDEIIGSKDLSDLILSSSYDFAGRRISPKLAHLKTRKGTEKPIYNPLLQAIVNEGKTWPKVLQQMMYNQLGEDAAKLPDYLINEIEYTPGMRSEGKIIVTTDKNFDKHAFEVDKNLRRLFDTAFNQKTMSFWAKLNAKQAKIFTIGTTGFYTPFALINLTIDSIASFIQSKNRLLPVIDSFKHSIDLLRKNPETGKYVNEYMTIMGLRNTNIGSIVYAEKLQEVFNFIKSGGKGKAERSLDGIVTVLSFPSQASELLTRLTEYVNARQAGKPQAVAREDSVRVSAPFAHRGFIFPYIRGAVYMNAGLQVLHITGNAYHRMLLGLKGAKMPGDQTNVLKRFIGVTTVFTALALYQIGMLLKKLNDAETEEEKMEARRAIVEYNSLSAYERANFIRAGEKPSIMRVPSTYNVIPNLVSMLVADKFLKSNFSPLEISSMLTESAVVQTSPTAWLPYFPKEFLLIGLGWKDFPELKRIEADYLKYLPPEERYYASTHDFAKWLGQTSIVKTLNNVFSPEMQISPIKIDRLIAIFGRAYFKQFFGEWSSDKNYLENFLTSFYTGFRNAIFKDEYLFVGREFEKFYFDKNKLDIEISGNKKMYMATRDKDLATNTVQQIQKAEVYNLTNELMSNLRQYNANNIDVPTPYIDSVYYMVDRLNRNDHQGALEAYTNLVKSKDFTQFIINSQRQIDKIKTDKQIEKYDKLHSLKDIFSIRSASAASLVNKPQILYEYGKDDNIYKRLKALQEKLATGQSHHPGVSKAYAYLTDKDNKSLYRFDLKEQPIVNTTIYHPMNPKETKENPDGKGSVGIKLKFGDVAISLRDVNAAVKKAARDNKFLYIYVKELDHIETPYGKGLFRVLDTKNERYDGSLQIDFVSDDIYGTWNYPKTKMERELVKARTLQYVVK